MKTISKERADEIDGAWKAATDLQRLTLPRLEWFSAGDGDVTYWEAQPTKLEMVAAARVAELKAALGKAIDYCDAATHGDGQYADERQALIRVWRGD